MDSEWEILSNGSQESWEDLGERADELKDYNSHVDLLNAMTDLALFDEKSEEGNAQLASSGYVSPPAHRGSIIH
jgi:hypothetical protein